MILCMKSKNGSNVQIENITIIMPQYPQISFSRNSSEALARNLGPEWNLNSGEIYYMLPLAYFWLLRILKWWQRFCIIQNYAKNCVDFNLKRNDSDTG